MRLHESDHGTLLIDDDRGRVLVLASALQPRDGWSPFVRFDHVNREVRLKTLGGAVVRCWILQDRLPGAIAPPGGRPQ